MKTIIRPYEHHDLSAVVDVLHETMPCEAISEPRFVGQVLLDANFRTEGLAVAEVDGKVIGACVGLVRHAPLENAPSDADRAYITLIGVLPRFQRQGIGSQLLRSSETYFRSQSRSTVMVASYAPGYFIPGVDMNAYPNALPFFAKNAYGEIYRPLAMQTTLWNLQKPQWVTEAEAQSAELGVKITPYVNHLALKILDFISREFPGDWVRVVRTAMLRILEGDSPNRILVASDGGQVVGFSHFERERFGPIGVAASQRGRRLGQMLMFRTLEAQRAAGYRAAWFLWSDDKTAQRLYNGAGFKEVRRFALLKKTLA